MNKDGHLDAVVSVEYGVNRLYLNDGTGKLIYQADAFGTVMHDSEHVRAADFDGDGNMDVVFVSESDEVHQPPPRICRRPTTKPKAWLLRISTAMATWTWSSPARRIQTGC